MKKSLRKIIDNAELLQNKADMALQQIFKNILFVNFEPFDEPGISMCTGNEIILEWHGHEIDKHEIIRLMETVGYITPKDFDITYEIMRK